MKKLTTLTKRQLEILILLYRFRFLNRRQIQFILNLKDPRRLNRWLSQLSTQNILSRVYSRRFGENTKPSTYYLSAKSRQFLKGQKEINIKLLSRIYKEKSRSQAFRERCFFIADIYLHLRKQAEENKSKLDFYAKTELEVHDYLPDPLPDAYIALEEKEETKRYFLEIISEQLPRFVLRNRIEYLFEYYDLQTWQEKTNHPFPAILMICPNYVIKGFLSKFISETLENEGSDVSFYLTAKDQIEARGMQPDIWQKVEAE